MNWLWPLVTPPLLAVVCLVTLRTMKRTEDETKADRQTRRQTMRGALRFWVAETRSAVDWATHRTEMALAIAPVLRARAKASTEDFSEWIVGLIGPTVRPTTFTPRAAARRVELARALARPMSTLARQSTYSLASARRMIGHAPVDWHAVEAVRGALEVSARIRTRLTQNPRVKVALRAWNRACLLRLVRRMFQMWRVAQRLRQRRRWPAGGRAMAWWSQCVAVAPNSCALTWQKWANWLKIVTTARCVVTRVVTRVVLAAAIEEWRGRGWWCE